VFHSVSLPIWLRIVLDIARWVVLAVLMVLAVSVIYRVAPYRVGRQSGRLSAGAVVAAVLWLVLSAGFSIYVQNFGSYAKTYGSLAAVVVLMLWLWLSAYAILLGAEINGVRRQQRVPARPAAA
jgi:membrane protein